MAWAVRPPRWGIGEEMGRYKKRKKKFSQHSNIREEVGRERTLNQIDKLDNKRMTVKKLGLAIFRKTAIG